MGRGGRCAGQEEDSRRRMRMRLVRDWREEQVVGTVVQVTSPQDAHTDWHS